MNSLEEKYQRLQAILRVLESVLLAFSGGVDSTLLAKVAVDVLGNHAYAVTACASAAPEFHPAELAALVAKLGIQHQTQIYDELAIPHFQENPPDRCYHCKRYLFSQFVRLGRELGVRAVLDGSQADDAGAFRPGMRALQELGIRSPLREAGLTKAEIRALSQQLQLPTWNKPAMPCLATRVPYYTPITREALTMISQAEAVLRELGFDELRVRHHGQLARIELRPPDMRRVFEEHLETHLVTRFKALGYTYITLDLQGFRSGSLNETLPVMSETVAN